MCSLRPPLARSLSVAICTLTLALAACSPAFEVSRHLDVELDHPKTVIERALAGCRSRDEGAETACVKHGIADAGLDASALARSIPGCRIGTVCRVDYTTEDRIGFVPAVASDLRLRWRVTVDLRKAVNTPGEIPTTVVQF